MSIIGMGWKRLKQKEARFLEIVPPKPKKEKNP